MEKKYKITIALIGILVYIILFAWITTKFYIPTESALFKVLLMPITIFSIVAGLLIGIKLFKI